MTRNCPVSGPLPHSLLTWYSASAASRRSRADSPAGSSMALSWTGAASVAAAAMAPGARPSSGAPSVRFLTFAFFFLVTTAAAFFALSCGQCQDVGRHASHT